MATTPESPKASQDEQASAEADRNRRRVSFLALFAAFSTIGITSFGGARAAYFRHMLVVSKGWISDHQFLEGLTISQILPGPNVSNMTVYFGQRIRGLPGALLAAIGTLLPGAVMILVLAILYFSHGNLPALSAIFKGVGAAAVGLSIATTWQVGRRGTEGPRDWIIVAVTFAGMIILRLPLLLPLVTIAPISVWLCRPRARQAGDVASADAGEQKQ